MKSLCFFDFYNTQKWRDEMAAIEKGLIPPGLMYQTKYFLQLFFLRSGSGKSHMPSP